MRENRTVVGEYFPLIHFISVVIIPFTYWVACIELGVYHSNENRFTVSFGQASALSSLIPDQNHSAWTNTRSSRFSQPFLRLSECANSHPAYSAGSTTSHGSGGLMEGVLDHEIPA